jgi:TetR/AcrR family transcriptional repressor of nem operon
MTGQSATREKLVSEGIRQMLAHGYEGIGIGPILASVKVPKGSFYHFFRSKDDYVIAIIDAYEEHYRTLRETIFGDTAHSPLARLDVYLETLERELIDQHPSGGCLYGVLAQTITARNPAIRDRLSASFQAWETSLRQLLALAKDEGEIAVGSNVADLAAGLVDAYEGALIRMKATDDRQAFTRFRTVSVPRLTGASML